MEQLPATRSLTSAADMQNTCANAGTNQLAAPPNPLVLAISLGLANTSCAFVFVLCAD
jgi:hypothetical protein